ncbi:MAG: hypothetical protein AAFW68_01075 [Pseudomonadota bacterium]
MSRLRARYEESGRFYHTWNHIEQLVAEYQTIESKITHKQSVLCAIYYHDAVYDVTSGDNEENSAKLFREEVAPLIDQNIALLSERMIVATKAHECPQFDDPASECDCKYFLDIDMSILGANRVDYDAYAANVRREYSIFEDAVYSVGRSRVLKEFPGRERLFFTDEFFSRYDEKARVNISRELAGLESEF